MISYIYASYIRKIDRFGPIILQNTNPEDFSTQVRESVIMGKTPTNQVEGTELFTLGTYDDKVAEIKLLSKPVKLCDFDDLMPKEENKA